MEHGLGEFGFWLMTGMVLAAMIVSGAIKDRDKEREKQATLRALLEKDGQSTSEVLAYMREKDATEAVAAAFLYARQRATAARFWRGVKVLAGLLLFALGLYAFGALRYGLSRSAGSAVLAMFGVWAAGLTIAWLMRRAGNQKNGAHPNA